MQMSALNISLVKVIYTARARVMIANEVYVQMSALNLCQGIV